MCGIAGVFTFKERTFDSSLLKRMNDLMRHRGPDAEGYYEDRHAHLAMRRLKVIDLSTGDQPIHNEDKSLWIIFNGEIYNYKELKQALIQKGHRFYTESDTEVILHQYQEDGEKCVQSLIGMFSFAIYDVKKSSLFIVRDRLGIKPLFYHQNADGIAFASEIKSILEVPWIKKNIDPQALSHFLSLNYLPAPWTPFEGIHQLKPGHWMKLEKNEMKIQQYWEIPLDQPVDDSEEAAIKKIESLLHKSIERRLIADVPIGAFLSGGLDSSTLVALMKEHKQGVIKTFSVGFKDSQYDETSYAKQVAKFFGTDHYEIYCDHQDLVELLPQIAWHGDNLIADQAILPLYQVSKLAREHVTVALSGDGGDEIFVGYTTFHADRFHAIYSQIPSFLRKNIIEKCVRALPASSGKLSLDYRAKKFIEAGNFNQEKAHYWWRTIYSDEEKKQLLRSEALSKIESLDTFPLYEEYFRKASGLDFGNRALFADEKVWLAGNNLYKVDSMTMAHSLEARVPFLDHELVEYMARLPFQMKFKGHMLKYLLKKIIKNKLPEAIVNRKKSGWHAPISGWFRKPLKDYVQQTLLKEHAVRDQFIDRQYVSKILSEHFTGKRNQGFKIWGLLVLTHWMNSFMLNSHGSNKSCLVEEKGALQWQK